MRIFTAVDISGPVKETILNIQNELKNQLPCVKWVEKDNLHITLKFIGDIEDNGLEGIKTAISGIAGNFSSFSIHLTDIGLFPNVKFPKIISAKIEKGNDHLKEISGALNTGLAPLGVEAEKRDFAAHLTVARIKDPQKNKDMLDLVTQKKLNINCSTKINAIMLIQSKITPTGPIYTLLENFNLCK
ncbi:MAG: 2'-5' RNA ligase [Elusimicrobia bacterium RIFOXYA2_FULL_39_19]|nr:MAG: 2'-5' RNA ligase [Elusimicrobia bacterium RIFOXYA2_FULL_39_19]